MTAPASPDLERFIRGPLGCHCPDDVFQSVAAERDDVLTRLVVGNRLLIYVATTASGSALGDTIARLTARGRVERDERRLNRFRLVIASSRPTQLLATAQEHFTATAGGDGRAHLHVIALDQLPAELRGDTGDVGNEPRTQA